MIMKQRDLFFRLNDELFDAYVFDIAMDNDFTIYGYDLPYMAV